jgi:hypothetical protein
MSKQIDSKKISAVLARVENLPSFQNLSPQVRAFLLAGLAKQNLLGVLTESGMTNEIAILVASGILKDSNAVRVTVAWALGLLTTVDAAPSDGGGGKSPEPAKTENLADQATAQIVGQIPTPEQPAVPVSALAGLTEPAPKLLTDRFVDEMLRDARKHVSAVQTSAWIN